MNYNSLYTDFKDLFPNYSNQFDRFSADAKADENDGIHVLFSFVVIPFTLSLLNNDKNEEIIKAFDYFEQMASSKTSDITEVLEFTVLENLISSGSSILEKSKNFMGTETLKSCLNIEKYLLID